MRRRNSLGGHRLYPSSPEAANRVSRGLEVLDRFIEGLDNLRNARELTEEQHTIIQNLEPNSQKLRNYHILMQRTESLWEIAMQKQASFNTNEYPGRYNTTEINEGLHICCQQWQDFKNTL